MPNSTIPFVVPPPALYRFLSVPLQFSLFPPCYVIPLPFHVILGETPLIFFEPK
jgi:hypothetical protein